MDMQDVKENPIVNWNKKTKMGINFFILISLITNVFKRIIRITHTVKISFWVLNASIV